MSTRLFNILKDRVGATRGGLLDKYTDQEVLALAARVLNLSEYYNPVQWTDIDFPIIIRTTGVGIPTLEVLNGNLTMPRWQVNDINISESQEFVHQWWESSDVYWHIHLTTNGTDVADKYVRFTVEYGYVTPNGQWVFPAVMDSGDILIAANTPDKTMKILSLGNFTPTSTKIGGHCIALLKRIAATGAAPTGDPWVAMLQLHIKIDGIGSWSMTTKA